MRQLVAQAWMTLDGVVQAPGDPEEDTTGGFQHGGWSLPYFEELAMKWTVENLEAASGFLLGRRTYVGSRPTGRTPQRKSSRSRSR